ncbi:MAG: hypothetical protein EOO14_02805 [Chitinophagaceae bacterium]|nr:MAG: hypothetical protein EOO14_02805 [Chitinophagaceae bacterium]
MTFTMVVFMAMATISLIVLVVISIRHNRKQKEIYRFLREFDRISASCNLSLSSREVLDNAILGLDGQQRKLLLLKKMNGSKAKAKLIDLEDVQTCVLQKHYTAYPSAFKDRKREQRLRNLALQLQMGDDSSEEIIFYSDALNCPKQLTRLANKARHWEVMLGKLLVPERKIA